MVHDQTPQGRIEGFGGGEVVGEGEEALAGYFLVETGLEDGVSSAQKRQG